MAKFKVGDRVRANNEVRTPLKNQVGVVDSIEANRIWVKFDVPEHPGPFYFTEPHYYRLTLLDVEPTEDEIAALFGLKPVIPCPTCGCPQNGSH